VIFVIGSCAGAAAIITPLCYVAERLLKRPFLGVTVFLALLLLVSVMIFLVCPRVYARAEAIIL
jgi:hypothetical protein